MSALLLVVNIPSHAQTTTEVQPAASIAPGPPLWKVSKGDHALWIFAMLTPLEAGVNWQSEQVEAIIARAQEYLYIKAPEPSLPLNPFKLVNGLRLVLKIRNNPDGKRLDEVIPADLYSRFSQLVALYQIPDMETTRPYYAADALRGYAVIANKLTEDHGVDIRIESLVSNTAMVRTPINLGPEYLDYDFLKDSAERMAAGASVAAEINCLALSIESVETDIAGMRLRARAWAEGNVDALRRNRDSIGAAGVCGEVLLGSLLEEANTEWLRAAETALANNVTTFAVLELDQLIAADGLLEKLRARGYTIEAP
jgi:hypothetical protein